MGSSDPKPMGGGKLFLIISGAVACGITIAILAYLLFIAAVRSASHSASTDSNLSPPDRAFKLSPPDQAFVDATKKGDVDAVKEAMLGNINWDQVATPGLINALQPENFSSPRYDPDDQQFWTQLPDRLIRNGASVNDAITSCYDVAALRFLLSRGANVNAKGILGCTPLQNCANSPGIYGEDLFDDSVAFLLANGANVNTTDPDGNTPLHAAAKSNSPKIIARLIAAGASVNAKNKAGQTPLKIAYMTMASDAVAALKANGGVE
jgi:ankyrin repeat protein